MKKLLRLVGHQEWLRFGLRDRIIRLFHTSSKSRDEPFEQPFYGRRYAGNFNTFLDWSVFYYGAYAKQELVCMGEFLEVVDNPVVVDVGANIGHHSLFASTIASHVHAFEPFPAVIRKWEEKMKLNAVTNATLHKLGLGEETEFLSYFPPTNSNTGTGTFCDHRGREEAIQLEVRRGDDYFDTAGISKIDYLKMDIEGFEIKALKGMREMLAKHRPVCFLEWSQPRLQGGIQNGSELFPANYQFYKFVPYESVLVFFNKKGYRLLPLGEVWPDGNCLAVPGEYVERVRAMRPLPKVAQRLKVA